MAIIEIFEQVLKKDKDGNTISKFAILRCKNMTVNDIDEFDIALAKYVEGVPMNMFIEISLSNPGTRVIISGIDKLKLRTKTIIDRDEKLKKINDISNGIQ